ncbi:MAG TPA: hypothetical protein PKO06_22060 [Candidatus Ozemobacteraceae bacterium]|nr:hypothetical protein [Candidatus Ozemobacteraceae bacterium]
MFRSFSLVCIVLFLSLICVVPAAALDRTISRVEVTQVANPVSFENSTSYEILYFATVEGIEVEVFPTRVEKEQDFDLILASIVRHYIENEYEANGKFLDETNVEKSTPQEICHLVSKNFVSAAWSKNAQTELIRFLQQNSNSLSLYRLDAYLDYGTDKGDYVSGLDTNPVLFRFGTGVNRDRVTFIQVNQTTD